MRVGLLVVGVASLLVGIGVACSDFSSSEPETAEAGTDAASSVDSASPVDAATADTSVGVDAALPPTPGKIDCFGTQCDLAGGSSCCVEPDAGAKSCAANCPLATLTFNCDDQSDCAPGKSCCVGFFGSTECATDCSQTNERLCHSNSECKPGSSCLEVACRGTTIGVCGPVGNYINSFCDAGP